MVCNYSNVGISYTSSEELASVPLFRCYPDTLLKFTFACYVVFMAIGIPGNLITIIALALCRKVQNATAIFIINLHISDLIFGSLILPMTATSFSQKQWIYGWILCRVYAYCRLILSAVAIFTILAITTNRYIIVCYPLWYSRIYKKRNVTIMLILIWILASAIFLPTFFGVWGRFGLEPNLGFCTTVDDKNGNSPKKFFVILAFAVPSLIIAIFYARILWVVMKNSSKLRERNPKPIRLTHSSLTLTQSNTSTNGKTLTRSDPANPAKRTTDDDKTPTSSPTSTPRDSKTFDNYFEATLKSTTKKIGPKAPTRRDKRLFAMIAAIILSYGLTHLPMMVTRLVHKAYNSDPYANVCAHIFSYLRICLNPIIYVLVSNEYRQAYRNLFEIIMNKFRR